MQITTGHAEINGAKIYYETAGSDQPLVLIHAALMNTKMWDEQFTAFAEHFRVIRYDLRGFGRSTMPKPASDVADLRELLKFLNVNEAHILGLSHGAEIATAFTLEHPDMVAGLVLVSPGLDGYDYPETASQRFMGFYSLVQERNFPAAIERFSASWVDGSVSPAEASVRERAQSIMREYSFAHYLPPETLHEEVEQPASEAPVEEISYVPAIARLGEIGVPTLIITGGNDHAEILDIAGVLASRIPNAKKVTIPETAHFPNLQKPDEFSRAVTQFLKP